MPFLRLSGAEQITSLRFLILILSNLWLGIYCDFFFYSIFGLCWDIPLIQACGAWSQEDQEFKFTLHQTVILRAAWDTQDKTKTSVHSTPSSFSSSPCKALSFRPILVLSCFDLTELYNWWAIFIMNRQVRRTICMCLLKNSLRWLIECLPSSLITWVWALGRHVEGETDCKCHMISIHIPEQCTHSHIYTYTHTEWINAINNENNRFHVAFSFIICMW